jgi:predicted membrane metal-binding protein
MKALNKFTNVPNLLVLAFLVYGVMFGSIKVIYLFIISMFLIRAIRIWRRQQTEDLILLHYQSIYGLIIFGIMVSVIEFF